MKNRFRACAVILALTAATSACGKKGPPLAPLRIAPAAVTGLSARRVGDRVQLRFTLPEKNTDNSTPADVARVEVYALSVEKPADAPEGEAFIRAASRVATVTATGEERTAAVSEALDEAASKYYVPERTARPVTAVPATAAPAAEAPATTTAAAGTETPSPVRMYMIVPVNARNRRGSGATVSVPLGDPPPAPAAPLATHSEKAITLVWPAGAAGERYHVYDVADEASPVSTPLTPEPASTPSFDDSRLEFGKRRCYRVTAVAEVARVPIESAPSAIACVTPADTFAPPAPSGLAAVAGPGTMSLIWDAVASADLAGYLVLRGSAPGDTLQALTPEPIKETTYRDATVTPGQTYVYAVVAIDSTGNRSAVSARVTEMAR